MTNSDITDIERQVCEELLDGKAMYDRVLAKAIVAMWWTPYNLKEEDVINIMRGMISKDLVRVTNTMNDSEGRTLCKYKANYTL